MRPISGSMAGAVMTSLPRGKCPHRTSQTVLFEGDEFELMGEGAKAGREASRAGTDDHHIKHVGGLPDTRQRLDRFHCLAALLDGIADQAHAAELACNEQPGHIGLKVRFDNRQLDAAGLGAKHQRDGAGGTGGLAGSVADAARRLDELGLVADEAEHRVPVGHLGAGANAGTAAQALHGSIKGCSDCRFGQARFLRLSLGRAAAGIDLFAHAQIDGPHHDQWDRVKGQDRIGRLAARRTTLRKAPSCWRCPVLWRRQRSAPLPMHHRQTR